MIKLATSNTNTVLVCSVLFLKNIWQYMVLNSFLVKLLLNNIKSAVRYNPW